MLRKLLKYDLGSIYKVLSIFYILSILSAIFTRIFFLVDNSTIANIIAKIFSGVTISMLINILINNIMGIWHRFKLNLYGDESYLTHTLPTSKKEIYLSKFLASIITIITSTIVIGITLFIAYYSKENIELVKTLLTPIASIYNSTVIKFLLVILLIFALEIISIIQSGYTGIILGHKKNNNKIVYSIVFGLVVYSITQLIVLAITFISGLFNHDIINLFISNNIDNIQIFKTIIYISIISYSILIITNYFINTYIFEKGVNVD